MLELIWLSIGVAITLIAVLVVVQLRLRQDRLRAPEPPPRPSPEPRQLVVPDTHNLETLAMGVSKDLATLASSVQGHALLLCESHAQLLCERNGTSGQVIEEAERLWESVHRLRLFAEKLQAFAQVEEMKVRPARVTPVLRALVHEIEDHAGGSLEVALHTAPSLPRALTDTRSLRQALLFLVESVLSLEPNAPTLTISAKTELNEDMDAEVLIEIQAETEELAESAGGPAPDIRFSYGAARNLLEAQKAWVSLTHRPGLSVVASVSLKATTATRSAAEVAASGAGQPMLAGSLPGSEVDEARQAHEFGGILILDRNPGIREMLTNELSRLGRHVIACDEGRAAESLYSATPERFELLILDQDARRLSGEALAARALAARQDVRVILLTSRPSYAPDAGSASDPRCVRIPKPFGLMELRSVVGELLGPGPATATIAAGTSQTR